MEEEITEVLCNDDSIDLNDFEEEAEENENIEIEIDSTNWKEMAADKVEEMLFQCSSDSQLKIELEKVDDPLTLFFEVFDETLISTIVKETNRYYDQNKKTSNLDNEWSKMTADQMKSFLGIIIALGICKRTALKDHWSDNSWLQSNIRNVISRRKFTLIWKYFHINNNESSIRKVDKIRPILDYCVANWKRLYKPEQKICIDESMIDFRGKVEFRQYEPSKPVKYGIKGWSLCESISGYMMDFQIYEGKKESVNETKGNVGENVVRKLVKDYENDNYILFTDSFYSSPKLCTYLYSKGITFIGMVRNNRKGLSKGFQKIELAKNEVKYFENENLLYLLWKDNKQISLLSNVKSIGALPTRCWDKKQKKFILRDKPKLIVAYSRMMKGVDINNMLCSYYSYEYKSVKWWKPVFLRILDITITNLYILHRKYCQKPKNHKEFILHISENLMKFHVWHNSINYMNITRENLTSLLLLRFTKNKSRDCRICKSNKVRRQTLFYCRLCYFEKDDIFSICKQCYDVHYQIHL